MRKGPNDIPLSGGWEMERLTRAKRYHRYGPGVGKYIKNGFTRRTRRLAREEINNELTDCQLTITS